MSIKRLFSLTVLSILMASNAAQAQNCPDVYIVQPEADPANSAYPAPSVTATCTGSSMTVNSNGIPGFEFQQITPGGLSEQSHSWTIPIAPDLPTNASDIPLLGTIAFSVNGLPIYGPNEGAQPANEAFGDPVFNGIIDFCLGHTGPRAEYHFHAMLAECIDSVTPSGEASPILGYALDGFPIYGSRGCLDANCTQVVEFQSSWVQSGDPSSQAWDNHEYVENDDATFLDECNGRIGPDGTYRYHTTSGFPYVLGCYAGEDILKSTTSSGGGGGGTAATGTVSFVRSASLAGESLGQHAVAVRRTGGNSGTLVATAALLPGTADAADASLANSSVTWEDGEQGLRWFVLDLNDDAVQEGIEELTLDLDANSANLGAVLESTIRLVDDDYGLGSCASSSEVLCLESGRFRVDAHWVDYDGNFGGGETAAFQTEDSGLFTFFDPLNVELLVKVLDGCGVNGSRWVFGAGATDVGYVVTVNDLENGSSYQFANSLSDRSPAVASTDALPSSCP